MDIKITKIKNKLYLQILTNLGFNPNYLNPSRLIRLEKSVESNSKMRGKARQYGARRREDSHTGESFYLDLR